MWNKLKQVLGRVEEITDSEEFKKHRKKAKLKLDDYTYDDYTKRFDELENKKYGVKYRRG